MEASRHADDLLKFRTEVREFFASMPVQAAVERIASAPATEEPGHLDIYRWLGERGWLAADWPIRYGGLGRGAAWSAVVTEEMTLAGVPDDAHVLSIDIVGAFLLRAGTGAQRDRYLAGLAGGERIAAVLFTEEHCGSDLARLTTRAEPDGDGWRLHGTKVYSQKSRYADFALCAARTTETAVAMHGITLFILPMRVPGVHVDAMPTSTNDQFNRVVIDGVRLTGEDVVGPVDGGWQLINDMLRLERTGIDFHGKARRMLNLVRARAEATGLLDDDLFAVRLADLDGRLRAGRAMAWEMVDALERGAPDPVASAMAKWYVTEQVREIVGLGLEVGGLDATLTSWDVEATGSGSYESALRASPGVRLASGTSEVMLYIVATGLGLL